MGDSIIQTPNIDRLAEQGVTFRNCFATTSIWALSRVSIFAGQYERRHGVRTGQCTYIRRLKPNPETEELYDVSSDPLQKKNLAADPEFAAKRVAKAFSKPPGRRPMSGKIVTVHGSQTTHEKMRRLTK